MAENYSRIFLLSHMRAFTSLAGHILGSHPAINGYFEMHISYDDAAALDRQLDILQDNEGIKQNSRYVFDKLLHNDYQLNLERLGLSDIKILVTLLEPEQAIKSIVDLFAQKETAELYASPPEAVNYYIERVKTLSEFCRCYDQHYYYYDAELFQAAPDRLLPGLSRWLDLDSPLSERYQIFSQTGKAGAGDSSNHIRSGRINKTRSDYSHVSIPEGELSRAQSVYRECRQLIIENATDALTQESLITDQ
ncbi:MAG: hypothetical protein JSW45_10785 [Thiotrichales bacterium]|nr:MAG: hypothetical protein JSW45_10785 [Thiotrichales bacterium]